MNYSTVLSEENQYIYYEFIKKLNNLLYKTLTSNIQLESLYKNFEELFLNRKKILENPMLETLIKERLEFHISESVYSKISELVRYILESEFKTKIIVSDYYVAKTYLRNTNIFANENTRNLTLQEICKEKLVLKEIGELATEKTKYNIDKEKAIKLVKKISIEKGRLLLHEKIFLWFPDYLDINYKMINSIMNEKGYLSIPCRYYIAIMAVCTIKCDYLLRTLEEIFLSVGGDERWLIEGLNGVPEKLKKLGKINNILAHQPWKLLTNDIIVFKIFTKEIYRGENSNESWNFNEFVHAAVILVTFHRLAAIVEALDIGVKSENDLITAIENKGRSDSLDKSSSLAVFTKEKEKSKNILSLLEIYNKEEEKDDSNKRKTSFKHNDSDSEDETPAKKIIRTNKDQAIFDKHINSFCTIYLDFDQHSDDNMSYLDFNWTDNSYDILKKFYSQGIDKLNEEIEYILNLTSNAIGNENKETNTDLIRRSMCCYVEKIMGYVNDDFDYSKVNKLLSITQKQFIKNVVCSPHKITNEDIGVIRVTYTPEEIVHIILIVLIVKNRLQMTFLASKLYEVWKKIDQ